VRGNGILLHTKTSIITPHYTRTFDSSHHQASTQKGKKMMIDNGGDDDYDDRSRRI
jgi:hypothetical protein